MNIFQMKTKPHGIPRLRQFIDEKFVCIGWPGIDNLENVDKNEIKKRLAEEYGYTGRKLGNALGQVNTFINTMQKGDIIIITERDWAYIGTVGKYVYEQKYDNYQDGMCHRRSVEWSDKILINSLDSSLQRLLSNRNTICQYPESVEESGIDNILGKQPLLNKEKTAKLESLFEEALAILENELKSEDPERRIKAATELIRLKNN